MDTKICKTCGVEKDLSDFPREIRKGQWYYLPHCKVCMEIKKGPLKKAYREKNKDILKIKKREYYQENKSILDEKNKRWAKENPERVRNGSKKYYDNHIDEVLDKQRERYRQNIEKEHERSKRYKEKNAEEIKTKRAQRAKSKRQNDSSFKLKSNVSRAIRGALKRAGGSKNGETFLKYVSYSIKELRGHLEGLFETWMSWGNWGVYDPKTWDDNDQSTWTWQIDHIIPQSLFNFSSMKDEEFHKCWSLNNLRPLSAKQNFLDGVKRIRHQGNK